MTPYTELLLCTTDKGSQFLTVDPNLEPIHDTPSSSEKNPDSESSSAINTEKVAPPTTQKQKAAANASVIREKKQNTEKNEHEFIILSEALETAADMSDEEEMPIVLLCPDYI